MRTATPKTARPKLPTHIAYSVEEREGKKAFWNKIGGAWSHADGKGMTLQLSAMPLSGRITLRAAQPKQEQ